MPRAACRIPRGWGLESLGVKIGGKGEIVVDAWSQTAVPSVLPWAT